MFLDSLSDPVSAVEYPFGTRLLARMGADGEDRTAYAKAVLAATVLMLAGLPMPWLSAGLGEGGTYAGLDFAAAWVPTLLCVVASSAFALAWWRTRNDQFAQYATLAAGFLLLFLLGMMVAIELFGDMLPTSLLPLSLRRSSTLLAAGIGIWTTLAGAALAVVASSGEAAWTLGRRAWRSPGGPEKLGATAVLVIMALLIGWLRYQPWLTASVLGEGFTLSAQAAPYVGPLSLGVVCLLVCALVLASLSLFQIAGLVAAGAGWLLTFLAAISVIGSETLGHLRLGDLLGDSGTSHSVTFHPDPAAWLTYVLGLVIALIGGFLVCWRHRSGES